MKNIWWRCNVCGEQNSEYDGECQFCECEGKNCKRDNCSDPKHFEIENSSANKCGGCAHEDHPSYRCEYRDSDGAVCDCSGETSDGSDEFGGFGPIGSDDFGD